ncbi:MAG: hypothetical protein LBB75_05230 [Oscillospiraceae bacterium]|jgi:hypothetical protein|nr:hypothetical protein [Oscillospiraceae bacterium]
MYRIFRRAAILLLALLLALCAGCAYFPFRDASALMRPPLPRDADARAIQALLQEPYGGQGEVVFKQPLEGGDAVAYAGPEGERVAVALFGVESGLPSDGAELKMALLRQEGAHWRLLCDAALAGAHLLALEFTNYADGGQGLLVRWRQPGGQRFAVYGFDPDAAHGDLRALCEGGCDLLQWADLDGDGARELFYALHRPNRAGAYKYQEGQFSPMGEEIYLDSAGLSYLEPICALNGGKEYLLFDADAPGGRYTEVVYWDGEALRAPFTSGSTFRERRIPLYAAEGKARIPSEYPMPEVEGAAQRVRWSEIAEDFTLRTIAENLLYLNTTQWIQLPADWAGSVTARPDPEDPRTLRFYAWDGRRRGKELFWLYSNGSESELLLRSGLTPEGERAGMDLAFLAEIHTDEGRHSQ